MCNFQPKANLDTAIEEVWKELNKTCKQYIKEDKNLQFNGDYNFFLNQFKENYSHIYKYYMKPCVTELDRHKIVSTMIVTFIECNFLSYSKSCRGKIFIAPQMIALEVGLNWMLMGLNYQLKEKGESTEIMNYTMPNAFACSTPYFEIFSRNLYYAHEKGPGLNPLDIAEKLFLLEYITLLSHGISPETLKYNDR